MDNIALKAYKAKLDEREEIYRMHKNSYECKISRYRTGIIFFAAAFVVLRLAIQLIIYGIVPNFLIFLLYLLCAVSFVALIVYSINYYRYTHMHHNVKIGAFTLNRSKNLLAILRDDEMQISTLKNQIAFIERERELKTKESNK